MSETTKESDEDMTHPATLTPSPAAVLDSRLAAMRAALDACPTEVPAALALPARAGLDAVAERLALGVDHTVVALFGGTGSGKSSLFNALSALEFADVGARRPTTSRAAACSWGDDASALLTFLGVDQGRRIRRESLLDAADQDELAGLVLLDVPDYDSVTTAHALQVDRLVPLADILVWVLDPQKYADSALHDGYLRRLGARQEDMLVLVNHIDELPASGQDQLLEDVRALLVEDGLADVTVLPVSAVRGDNLDQVRRLLIERVARPSNAARTAEAELNAIAARLAGTVAAAARRVEDGPRTEVVDALVQASGARAVEASVATSLSRALPGALARPEPPARAAVASARSQWLARVTHGLPGAWARSVEEAVAGPDALGAQTAEGVGSVPLPSPRSTLIDLGWWAGLLAVLGAAAWLALSLLGGGGVPLLAWDTLLGPVLAALLGCAAAGWAAWARRRRAGREAAVYARLVRTRVDSVVERGLVSPATRVLERHAQLRRALGLSG